VSIFDGSKVVGALVLSMVALAVLRCGPPEQCLRISDCSPGLTCAAGACVSDDLASSSDEAGVSEAGRAVDAMIADSAAVDSANATTDAASADSASSVDAATVDSGDSSVP
jgi:hypothetical protein